MSTKLSLKAVTGAKKIDSPLAKYNSVGQLFCILCNAQVKNEMYWTGHINGKGHRDQVAVLKSRGASAAAATTKTPTSSSSLKRPAPSIGGASRNGDGGSSSVVRVSTSTSDSDSSSDAKKFKAAQEMMPPPPVPMLKNKSEKSKSPVLSLSTPPPQVPVRKTFKEIEAEEEAMEVEDTTAVSRFSNTNLVPPVIEEDGDESNKGEADGGESGDVGSGEALPEGFFDDAKEDAKARGLQYKNPEEAEWDRFVKEIASEEVKSSALKNADEEYSAKDRELEEIEEQMKNWQRVLDLDKKAKELRKQVHSKVEKMDDAEIPNRDDEENASDDDFEEDLDWRSKKKY